MTSAASCVSAGPSRRRRHPGLDPTPLAPAGELPGLAPIFPARCGLSWQQRKAAPDLAEALLEAVTGVSRAELAALTAMVGCGTPPTSVRVPHNASRNRGRSQRKRPSTPAEAVPTGESPLPGV
jgi:hypothetical protein